MSRILTTAAWTRKRTPTPSLTPKISEEAWLTRERRLLSDAVRRGIDELGASETERIVAAAFQPTE